MPKAGWRDGPSQTALGFGAIALAALLWAAAASVASDLFDSGVEPLELVQARAIVAVCGLAIASLIGQRRRRRKPIRAPEP